MLCFCGFTKKGHEAFCFLTNRDTANILGMADFHSGHCCCGLFLDSRFADADAENSAGRTLRAGLNPIPSHPRRKYLSKGNPRSWYSNQKHVIGVYLEAVTRQVQTCICHFWLMPEQKSESANYPHCLERNGVQRYRNSTSWYVGSFQLWVL